MGGWTSGSGNSSVDFLGPSRLYLFIEILFAVASAAAAAEAAETCPVFTFIAPCMSQKIEGGIHVGSRKMLNWQRKSLSIISSAICAVMLWRDSRITMMQMH